MALLSHEALTDALSHPDLGQRLVMMPLLDKEKQVGPASIDVRLGTQFRAVKRVDGPGIDARSDGLERLLHSPEPIILAYGDPLWLHPGQFILGTTLEYLKFPAGLAGYVVGRSSWGRIGLLVATAIMIQPGFEGCLTLELVNHGESPIALYAGSRIAQIAVHSLDRPTDFAYSGEYDRFLGPEVARLKKERPELEHLERVSERLEGTPSEAKIEISSSDGES